MLEQLYVPGYLSKVLEEQSHLLLWTLAAGLSWRGGDLVIFHLDGCCGFRVKLYFIGYLKTEGEGSDADKFLCAW